MLATAWSRYDWRSEITLSTRYSAIKMTTARAPMMNNFRKREAALRIGSDLVVGIPIYGKRGEDQGGFGKQFCHEPKRSTGHEGRRGLRRIQRLGSWQTGWREPTHLQRTRFGWAFILSA